MAGPARPSRCFSGLEKVWKAWHILSVFIAGRGSRITALGAPTRYYYSGAAVHIPCAPACCSVPGFSMGLHLPRSILVSPQSVQEVHPGTDTRRCQPTWFWEVGNTHIALHLDRKQPSPKENQVLPKAKQARADLGAAGGSHTKFGQRSDC